MKRALLVVVAFGALAGCPEPPATPIAQPTPPRIMAHDEAGQVKEIIEAWREAYEARNLGAFEALYTHDDDTLIVYDGQPFIGWASVDTVLRDRVANAREVHIRLKEVQVSEVAPTAAAAVATMTRESGDGTTTVRETGALTLVLTKTDDGWKIAAEHYSYRRGA